MGQVLLLQQLVLPPQHWVNQALVLLVSPQQVR
jgi:hypothetical protein